MFSIFQYIWLQVSYSSDQTTNPETTNPDFFSLSKMSLFVCLKNLEMGFFYKNICTVLSVFFLSILILKRKTGLSRSK